MLALATSSEKRAKIDEKSHVFWDLDFGRSLGRFWEAKFIDFRIFFDDFSKHFSKCFLEGKKIAKKNEKRGCRANFGTCAAVCADLLGGIKGGDEIGQIFRFFRKGHCEEDLVQSGN